MSDTQDTEEPAGWTWDRQSMPPEDKFDELTEDDKKFLVEKLKSDNS